VLRLSRLTSRWLPVVLWMMVIFSASSDQASFTRTSRFIGPLVQWLFPQISERWLHAVILAVRKCAHLTEYAILAALCWRALRPAGKPDRWDWKVALTALLLLVFYAATDEFHQKFVPSREASVLDVLIDSLGGALGLFVVWLTGRWRKLW
jgi:VanZ family protein